MWPRSRGKRSRSPRSVRQLGWHDAGAARFLVWETNIEIGVDDSFVTLAVAFRRSVTNRLERATGRYLSSETRCILYAFCFGMFGQGASKRLLA